MCITELLCCIAEINTALVSQLHISKMGKKSIPYPMWLQKSSSVLLRFMCRTQDGVAPGLSAVPSGKQPSQGPHTETGSQAWEMREGIPLCHRSWLTARCWEGGEKHSRKRS